MYGMFSDLFDINLLLLLLVILLLLFIIFLLLSLGSLGVSGLLAGPLSEPLWQPGLGSLGPLGVLVLPHGLQPFCPENLSSTLIQLLSLSVSSCVCSSLVFGE